MRPHGRARVSSRSPSAFAICDRCGFLYNHSRLQWQYDWAGASLINKRILVCNTCNDAPQQQLRAIVVPADPVPIQNPRIQDYVNASQDIRTTQGNTIDPRTGIPVIGGDTRVLQNGNTRVSQQTGEPPNGLNIIPGAILTEAGYGNPNLPYDATAIPETGWLPGVNYIVWNNNSLAPTAWVNGQSQVVTWLPNPQV